MREPGEMGPELPLVKRIAEDMTGLDAFTTKWRESHRDAVVFALFRGSYSLCSGRDSHAWRGDRSLLVRFGGGGRLGAILPLYRQTRLSCPGATPALYRCE